MAGTNTEPRSGLFDHSDRTSGESGWGANITTNTRKIGRLAVPNLYVDDRDLTAPPGSPSAGDAYIVGASATGDWASHDDDIAVWDGSAWVFYTPAIGWLCYLVDEEKITAFKAAGWSAGIAV